MSYKKEKIILETASIKPRMERVAELLNISMEELRFILKSDNQSEKLNEILDKKEDSKGKILKNANSVKPLNRSNFINFSFPKK